jgi:hypothetical protein
MHAETPRSRVRDLPSTYNARLGLALFRPPKTGDRLVLVSWAFQPKVATMRRGIASIALAFLLVPPFSQAQDESFSASAGKFQCRDGADFSTVDDQYRGVSLTPLDAAPKDLPAALKPRTFGPFPPNGWSVEFYQFLTGGGGGSMATETDLHLYLRVLTAQDKRWYEFQPHDPTVSKADGPLADADLTANDQHANQEAPANKAPSSDPADIFTPDPAIPLFQISYGARWMGANAGGTYGHIFIFDLRSNPPAVAKQLECTHGEGGGVCTAPDSSYGLRGSVSCEWRKTDYICNEHDTLSMGWGERFSDATYSLLSGKDAYTPPPEAVNAIEWIPDRTDRRKPDGQRFLVPWLGDSDEIFSLKQSNQELYLMAARGSSPALHMAFASGNSFDERFFLAEHPLTDRPSVAVELQPSTASTLVPITYPEADRLREKAAKAEPPPVTSREGGAPISYKVKKIYGDDSFFVLQVTVKEGKVHAIYWVGVDQRSDPIVADLYRLSTDALPYYHCNRFVQEENAAAYHLAPGAAFHATIEVEPLHITDGNGGLDTTEEVPDQAPGKVCTKHVSWDRTKGFVFAENPVCKPAAPARSIAISDDGQITTKSMLTDTNQ